MPFQNPALGRRVFATLLSANIITITAAAATAHLLQAGPEYVLIVALVLAGTGGILVHGVERHHPFSSFGPANVVTTLRLALVSLVAGLVVVPVSQASAWTAALVSVVVVVLDGVDGWLARRSGLASVFGARFDMETDALVILVLAVIAWQHGRAGAWIVLAGAMRYLFVAAGYVWRWMQADLPPSLRRKAVCVLQIGGLCAVVAPVFPAPVAVTTAAVTLAALAWSFGVDVAWLRRHGA